MVYTVKCTSALMMKLDASGGVLKASYVARYVTLKSLPTPFQLLGILEN